MSSAQGASGNGAHRPDFAAVAPAWHTAVLLVFLAVLSILSAHSHTLTAVGTSRSHVSGYLTILVAEWILAGLVWYGIRRRGVALRELVGGGWPRWTVVLRDFALAIAFLIASNLILAGVARLLHATPQRVARSVAPHGGVEIAVYLLLSATAGFCEELIFRGYLQKQFTAWTQNEAAGVLLQGVIFGAAHAYQGVRLMMVITVFGFLFGSLALWRGSLRPGMLAHWLQDSVLGVAAGLR